VLGPFVEAPVSRVDQLEELLAALNGGAGGAFRQGEIGDGKVLPARVRDGHRVIAGAEKAGAKILFVLARTFPLRHEDVRGHFALRAGFPGDDGSNARKLHGRVGFVAGDRVVGSLRMVVAAGVHGANKGDFVHAAGHFREQFGDLDARDVGGDGLEG
jgi:hypothetical protein